MPRAAQGGAHRRRYPGQLPKTRRARAPPLVVHTTTAAAPSACALRDRDRSPRGLPPVSVEPLGVAVIGTGFVASMHLTALKKVAGVRLAGVADVDAQRARAAGAGAGYPRP